MWDDAPYILCIRFIYLLEKNPMYNDIVNNTTSYISHKNQYRTLHVCSA